MKSSFEELLRDLQIISKELFLSSWNLVSTTNLNTAKEITNKIPQSQSPPAENLDKKHIFSVYCRNKTAMYHDRAQIFRCGVTQQPYKHHADTVRIRPPSLAACLSKNVLPGKPLRTIALDAEAWKRPESNHYTNSITICSYKVRCYAAQTHQSAWEKS